MQAASFEETIEQIAAQDVRYHGEAYFFLREALDHTQKLTGKPPKKNEVHHVSGQELLNASVLILAVFLMGLGIGSTIGASIARDPGNARRALGWCQLLLCGAMALAGMAILVGAY